MIYPVSDEIIINPVYHGIPFYPLVNNFNINRSDFGLSSSYLKKFEEEVACFIDKTLEVSSTAKSPLINTAFYPIEIKKFYWIEHIDIVNFDAYDEIPILNYFHIIISKFEQAGLKDKLFFLSNNIKPNAFKKVNHIPITTFLGVSRPIKPKHTIHVKLYNKFKYKFLFLNRKTKKHRTNLFKYMNHHHLLDDTLYSIDCMSTPDSLIPGNTKRPPFFDGIDVSYSNQTFCSIITETMFYYYPIYNSNIFFTEKVDRCFAQFTPFIIVSTHKYLHELKKLGFRTFDKWWNESYDDIEDDNLRLKQIQKVIKFISSWSLEECDKVYREMEETLYHNYSIFNKIKKYRLKHDYLSLSVNKADYFNFCFFDDLKKELNV